MLEGKREHRIPAGTGTIGMWLFLAALTMLFAGTMLAYVIVRARSPESAGVVRLPPTLVVSTLLILVGSVTIHLAVQAVRRERQRALRRWLGVTCGLAVAFVVVQSPAMWDLIQQHRAGRAASAARAATAPAAPNAPAAVPGGYGLAFFLILVHALHVAGGIVALALATRNAFAGTYDHENYAGVRHAAMYWHFLDVVWIIMYGGMLLAR